MKTLGSVFCRAQTKPMATVFAPKQIVIFPLMGIFKQCFQAEINFQH